MPMDINYTSDPNLIKSYSLALIDFFEELPDSFFEDDNLTPRKQIVDNIIDFSTNKISNPNMDSNLFRFLNN